MKQRPRLLAAFALAALLGATLVGCQQANKVQLSGTAQGTYYSITYFDNQHRNLQPQVDSILDAFDQSASLWVDSSLLRRINSGEADTVDAILDSLFRYSIAMQDYTNGAFNVCIGKLVQMWGFSFKQQQELDSATIDELVACAQAGGGLFHSKVHRFCDSVQFDFNAIAQGYSVDLLASYFDSLGIDSYLIDVGGEVIGRGGKPDGSAWQVGVEKPSEGMYDAPEVMLSIPLRDRSVVTSGSYRKYYERDGMRYSHTIDPTTGRPVQHSLLSVTVVDDKCWATDAMATAYMVMGLDSAKVFIEQHPGQLGTDAVLFIYDDHGTLATYATPAFEALLNE